MWPTCCSNQQPRKPLHYFDHGALPLLQMAYIQLYEAATSVIQANAFEVGNVCDLGDVLAENVLKTHHVQKMVAFQKA
jgi:hypothetical protein